MYERYESTLISVQLLCVCAAEGSTLGRQYRVVWNTAAQYSRVCSTVTALHTRSNSAVTRRSVSGLTANESVADVVLDTRTVLNE